MGDIRRNAPEGFQALGGFEIEERARVKLARPRMGIINAPDAILVLKDGLELRDIGGQVTDIHRRVLDDLAGLGIADDIAHQPLTGAA